MSAPIARVVIVCGDRNWSAPGPIQRFLTPLPVVSIVITGGAPGADTLAWNAARKLGHRTVRMDAPWEAFGKRAGPVRNQWMLELLLALKTVHPSAVCDVHAFHAHIASSKGTADMLARARNASIPYEIHAEVDP